MSAAPAANERTTGSPPWKVPLPDVLVDAAIDEVTIALRTMRGLRPGQENNFDIITQDTALTHPHRSASGQRQTLVSGNAVMIAGKEFSDGKYNYCCVPTTYERSFTVGDWFRKQSRDIMLSEYVKIGWFVLYRIFG